ncbi:hypothetical protein [Rathayibacter sp. VKM Ac-2760]|uniref:hypothetical protein n=1 Tax=Rathayibacter sp. VKM Ac-2760 TaxID=2609253 RepID=UPI001316812D|nr:hypothetical protein [Rathayibacter sp. VKM Ac-2760]QHC58119.1 hypothetical protein GSU72_05760 [Rathayibacter sp. VKM Ac-2760]
MTSQPPTLPERLQRSRSAVSVLAGTTSERQVRPLREAIAAAAGRDAAGAAALLDTADALAELIDRAETQLSALERTVRDDLERAGTLADVRTTAQLASAADVATACAAASALLLSADDARSSETRHDPSAVLALLLEADAALDAVVAGYRDPRAQAQRQLLLVEGARTVALLGVEAVALLVAVHGERITAAPRILAEETRAQLAGALRIAATDPSAALAQARAADDRARSALDEALLDLDGPAAPSAEPLVAAPGELPAA